MKKFTVLICFSDTGGGHRSATKAIKSALESVELPGSELEVLTDEVVEKSNYINSLYVAIYNYLLRYHTNWMKYYYRLIEWSKPNQSSFGYWLSRKYAKDLFIRTQPSIIVSVHPMANHYIALARKELKIEGTTKFIIVVTDPNDYFWIGWCCHDADLTIVPNDLAQERLITLGIDPARIRIIGMPVGPEFSKPPVIARKELLTQLGLDPETLTICLSGGSAGGGRIIASYDALRAVQRPIQVIVLCGQNNRVMSKIEKKKRTVKFKSVVLAYVESLSDLLAASDLLITKPGGLTTFEAIARGVPMAIDMLTELMPQEAGTAKMLIETKLAKPIRKPSDIVPIVESLEVMSKQAPPAVHSLDRVNAIYEIAEAILAFDVEIPAKQKSL